ncbi:glyceraldehyde-3-phosphate dehydrogenase [Cenarchaeum symbiosum A]|uniref:Glyceraldehyde-3-phosphate dehydrogenase n=1 Tax=Cenarchaeum symbiosum (strain A) TaxID=414004 RepID=A0RW87_CENSY|nr:glyceraldehyde-3-phosphate dehydrogenase [Cenarchaeum symbiosum A]
MKRVFVNGYGSIGRRLASFLSEDDEIDLTGVAKYSPGAGVSEARSKGLNVYVPHEKKSEFAEYETAGSIEDAVRSCDLVIDASPGGRGYDNKKSLYEPLGRMAIYQGGETIYGERAVSDVLFNSRANYDSAIGKSHILQGSCNVTGMGRILKPLYEKFGSRMGRIDVTLVRRWADIEQKDKEITDTIEMTPHPHHGEDVRSYMGDIPLFLRAIKVPTRQMHLHIMDVRFTGGAPQADEVLDALSGEQGVAILWTARGTREVRQCADSMGFGFADTNMVHVHANMASAAGDTIQLMYSDDQTGIVIPENHMLLQAMLFGRPYAEAAARTESLFRMGEKKKILEDTFAR